MQFRSVTLAALTAGFLLGGSALALAHGPGGGGGNQPSGWRQGSQMDPRMMSPGQMGPGMMGPGQMGPGLMAPGQMRPGQVQPLREDLSADDVQHMMGHWLSWQGNPNIKLGKVEEKNEDTIVAEIVTKDGSLVRRLEVNRHTGWMQPAQ